MSCKKHPIDYSSSSGVCATCLRERLLAIIEAQSKAQSQAQEYSDQAHQEAHRKPKANPRSVSPYISRRESDTSAATWHHHHHLKTNSLPDRKFFSTPQIGPTGATNIDHDHKKKSKNKFGLFSKLFRSKSDKPGNGSSFQKSTTVTSSPAWLSSLLSRNKHIKRSSGDELAIKRLREGGGDLRGRGMSPALNSDEETEAEPSGYTSDEWRTTPKTTPARFYRKGGGRSSQLSRNMSGISICLSPMVRASPGQNWTHKGGGAPPEMVVSGEIRMPIKSHSITASLCKNRSRKLADFGRSSQNR